MTERVMKLTSATGCAGLGLWCLHLAQDCPVDWLGTWLVVLLAVVGFAGAQVQVSRIVEVSR